MGGLGKYVACQISEVLSFLWSKVEFQMILNPSSAQVRFLAQLVYYPITHFNSECSSNYQW